MLIQSEAEFMKKLQAGELPDPDGTSDYTKALSEKYSKGDIEDVIDLTQKDISVKMYFDLQAMIDGMKRQQEQIKQKIQKEMGDHQKAELAGAVATWKPFTTSRFDSKKFKEQDPEGYEAYTKQTQARRFSMKQTELNTKEETK